MMRAPGGLAKRALVSIDRALIAQRRAFDLRWLDRVVAVLLIVGALIDASSELGHGLDALAIVSLVVLGGSVAWRRVSPALTTAVAVTAVIVFVAASGYGGDGTFEAAAIALNFYLFGRRALGRASMEASVVVFAYWLAGCVAIAYIPAGGSVGTVLAAWVLFGGLPFVVGRVLAGRSALTRELEVSAARLENEQTVGARRAAAEERNRMARELHDVIAHNVSVMVIQTSAAREVALRDLDAALEALRAFERSWREALVELRRIVGVLRRGTDDLSSSSAPGVSELDALAARARAAGLPVEVNVEGRRRSLSAGLDLVAYRVVQEALTNAIKYAGRARASVTVTFGTDDLELLIVDTGQAPAREQVDDGSGHGLVGMRERVAIYSGELHAGRRHAGGFEVRARIPLDGIASPTHVHATGPGRASVIASDRGGLRWPWLDPVLAGVLLVAFELAVLSTSHRRGPLAANMIAVAAMALVTIGRRRSPLLFLIVVGALAIALTAMLTSLNNLPPVGLYVAVVPTYTIAAWQQRPKALLGLAIMFSGAALNNVIATHGTVGDFAGAAFMMGAAWAAGRAIRARHALTSDVIRRADRLVAKREDRERLAVAGERSRIARELHALVAHSVAGMVIQTEAARTMLASDQSQADRAMSEIETTGRQALIEMRRIPGVLRHDDPTSQLEPQPGIDQIYTLIQHAREHGQTVELSVDGEPGTLAAGVDLGIYRILEDALTAVPDQGTHIGVSLRFSEEDLELHLTARCPGPTGWPTLTMRERVALCGGELNGNATDDDGWQFAVRLPRGLQGALA